MDVAAEVVEKDDMFSTTKGGGGGERIGGT